MALCCCKHDDRCAAALFDVVDCAYILLFAVWPGNSKINVIMKISEKGLDLIRKYEGLRFAAYVCPGGKLTIGYGHTGPDVYEGWKIDAEEANELLERDVKRFERSVNELVHVPLTQGMFDALVSFSFNLGTGSLKSSTLLKRLNAGDFDAAADEFLKWNKAKGKVLAGLTARREHERELFLA